MNCGRALGFDPVTLAVVSVKPPYRQCRNGKVYSPPVCNWLVRKEFGGDYCLACGLNDLIPNLDTLENLALWRKLETSKRRLLYTLMILGLPVAAHGSQPGLRFRFMEDRRRNPDVLEDFVATGHAAGTITINVAEADAVERTAVREAMHERYRTLLGHFRHESGHYYFGELVESKGEVEAFRAVFGDEREDYEQRLQAYYRDGPPRNWSEHYVSPYATAHPHEDWAETFAHYLHIVDALESARGSGLSVPPVNGVSNWIQEWMSLSVTLNEISRSLGVDDPYPFVLTSPVIDKLEFIHRLAHR